MGVISTNVAPNRVVDLLSHWVQSYPLSFLPNGVSISLGLRVFKNFSGPINPTNSIQSRPKLVGWAFNWGGLGCKNTFFLLLGWVAGWTNLNPTKADLADYYATKYIFILMIYVYDIMSHEVRLFWLKRLIHILCRDDIWKKIIYIIFIHFFLCFLQ